MNSFTTMKLHKTLTLKDLEKAKALIDREKLDTPLPGYVMGLKAHRDLEDAIRIKEPLMMPMFSMAQDFYGISIFKTKNLKPEEIWEFEDWEDAKDFLGFINFCTERNINWRVILEAVKHARRPLIIPGQF